MINEKAGRDISAIKFNLPDRSKNPRRARVNLIEFISFWMKWTVFLWKRPLLAYDCSQMCTYVYNYRMNSTLVLSRKSSHCYTCENTNVSAEVTTNRKTTPHVEDTPINQSTRATYDLRRFPPNRWKIDICNCLVLNQDSFSLRYWIDVGGHQHFDRD